MKIVQPKNRLIVLSDDNGNFINTKDFTNTLKKTIQKLKLTNLRFENLGFEIERLHDPKFDAQLREKYGKELILMDIDKVENLFKETIYDNPNSEMSELKKRLYRYFIVTVKNDTQGKLLFRLFNKSDMFLPYIEQAWFDHLAYAPPTTENQILSTKDDKTTQILAARTPLVRCLPNWNLDLIGRTGLTGLLGDKVVVAVLDGGIRTAHNAFGGRIWVDENGIKGVSLVNSSSLSPGTHHGTQVAGLAVGTYGVASKATIMNVKITDTLQAYVSIIAKAIHICTDYGIRIMNISYTVTGAIRNEAFYPAQDQIEYAAVENDRIIVFSAGNANINARLNVPPNAPENCIIVGGFGCDGALWRESATYGTNTGDALTVTAPADYSITASQGPNANSISNTATMQFNGTSAAAPHVAGLIAIMLSRNPGLTLAEIKDTLRNNTTGGAVGMVNVLQAVNHMPTS